MDHRTRRALEALNRAFYAQNAAEFDASRASPWRGFARALSDVPAREPLSVLDLGCGNGRLLAYLARSRSGALRYVGVDSCAELLASAATRYATQAAVSFTHAELVDDEGEPALPEGSFDVVALLGVLHHLPGEATRRALVQAALSRLTAGGVLVVTAWRFADSPRFAARIAPWSETLERFPEIDPGELEPGDALLRWSTHPTALRYCHAATPDEVDRWLHGTSAQVSRFLADGSGELNEYVVARRV